MDPNVLLEKIRAGNVVFGMACMYPASGIIESTCRDWDFVWLDGQHGQFGYESLLHAVQTAAATGVETLLRVPGHEDGLVGPLADLSPSAIMVPMVNNAEEAKAIVGRLRFPPLGHRSYGGRRVIDLYGRDYYRDRDLMVVAQIETLEAVDHAEEIIATEGIDCLFFGPDDMKVRMDIPINTPPLENPKLTAAMEKVAAVARAAGKFAGTVTPSPAATKAGIEMGYQMLVGGGDIMFLRLGAADCLEKMRAVAGEQAQTGKSDSATGVYSG